MQLSDGDRVVVVGGGPAGSLFACFLLQGAARQGLEIDLTILDGKDFQRTGPSGCNMCAGVISRSLLSHLAAEGLHIPGDRIQSSIQAYRCITSCGEYTLDAPRDGNRILTVFRGNGPRLSGDGDISFDALLLQRAQSLGARLVRSPVQRLLPEDKPLIVHGHGPEQTEVEADLAVIAGGLNSRLPRMLVGMGFGYRPPRSVRTIQAELPLGPELAAAVPRDQVMVFSLGLPGIRFGALTPKRDFLTLSLVGWRDLTLADLRDFVEHPRVREILPLPGALPAGLCTCSPRVADRPARQPYSDRVVVIGDAAANRYFKNGIESAFHTARRAAHTVLEVGYSRAALDRGYGSHIRNLRRDNRAGRAVYWLNDRASRTELLLETQQRVSLDARRRGAAETLDRVRWSTLTGNEPYRRILRWLLSPALQWRLLITSLLLLWRWLLGSSRDEGAGRDTSSGISGSCGPPGYGRSVAIVGGGPAGTSCAVALCKLAREQGRSLRVLLFEPKDYESDDHHNQCAGVMSPPIQSLFEEELGVPFPDHLVKRHISGYVLHGDRRSLTLQGEEEDTCALRRIEFDRYMVQQAREAGAEVVEAAMDGLEIHPDHVLINSAAGPHRVEAVVGAFGLEDATCQLFEQATDYRRPRCLETLITKVHPEAAFMARFGHRIHAWLPRIREVDFGAVTPKGDHLTINIAGETISEESMTSFLGLRGVNTLLPPGTDPARLDLYRGRFPNGPGRGLYGDRYLVIGDASGLLRPFKGKGVTAACHAGVVAAQTIMRNGLTREALAGYEDSMSDLLRDMPYGAALRQVAIRLANFGLVDRLLQRAERDPELKAALYYSVSGEKPFWAILRDHLGPVTMTRAGLALMLGQSRA